MALDRYGAVPAGFLQITDHGPDVLGVRSAADRHFRGADARLFAAGRGGQGRRDVLDVAVRKVLAQGLAELQRVLASDERIARVEVEAEVRRVEVFEQPRHEVEVARIRAVGLDVDDHAVVLGPGEALPVVVAGNAEDLLERQARGLEGPVNRIDHRAAQFGGEADRLLHVLHAEGRTVGAHHGVGAVDLRDFQAELLQVLSQGPWIGLERDGRVVAQGLKEVLAVDHGKFDVPHAQGGNLLAGGFETLAQRPPVVGVDSNLDHGKAPGKKVQ